MNDPLDLFDDPPQPATKKNTLAVLLLGIVLGVFGHMWWQGSDFDWQRDRDEQVEPSGKVAWVVILEETGDRARFPYLAEILADDNFWDSLEGLGVRMIAYDDENPNANRFLSAARDVGMPALILVDKNGDVLKSMALPDSTKGVERELRRL